MTRRGPKYKVTPEKFAAGRDAVRPRSRQAANQPTPVNEQPLTLPVEVAP